MARLLLGVSGSIAAYKAVELVRLATAAGHRVRVVSSDNAARFVGAASFTAVSGAPVLTSEFDPDPLRGAYPGDPLPEREPISHLALVHNADGYVIAPASAATIADLAGGHARSMLTTAALAADCPVLIAPAMNDRMYRHPATRANLARLARWGVRVIGPGHGALASHGEHGSGRMSEPAEILAAVQAALDGDKGRAGAATPVAGAWRGLRVLVTAGGTREPIDAVRFVGNRSSGRMGYALAAGAAARGAEVTLLSANVALRAPDGVCRVEVGTAAELADACRTHFSDADVLLMAAAVADFRPRDPAGHKLKKADGPPRIELEPTPDILAGLAARARGDQLVIGFAAEHGPGAVQEARRKLDAKRLDAVVLNDVARPGIGFDASENEVIVLTRDGRELTLARADKARIADGILDRVGELTVGDERAVHAPGAARA